jgi:hypothetical protein
MERKASVLKRANFTAAGGNGQLPPRIPREEGRWQMAEDTVMLSRVDGEASRST